jgi:hypothetical protein
VFLQICGDEALVSPEDAIDKIHFLILSKIHSFGCSIQELIKGHCNNCCSEGEASLTGGQLLLVHK